ncbi:copper amine oxidase N-terminal domain-containing protein [Paenibacillus sp.]|uniref:copper amine oxidase N-terminal domain-containing protein n=1 Tax=Paenibacillus sp. TaxID=58172 RepID=UPI002811223E|nr:copper amine oxidase N-terminal domain-containing protein [Paenibacillus sp.]
MNRKTGSKKATLLALAAVVASMSIGSAVVGAAEGNKGKGAEKKSEASVQAETSVTADVYSGGKNGDHGQGNTKGLENALLKLEGKPSAEVILEILADRTVDAAALALELEADGEIEAAVVAQQEAAVQNPTDAKVVKKLAKLLNKAGHMGIKAFVNGKQPVFDVKPFAKNGRTLVPFRAIAASLKADVSFDATTQTVTVVRGDVTVKLTLGSDTAYVNDVSVKLDVAAESVEGRTVIPLRFLAEAFDAKVEFDAETQSVIITE